MVPYNLSYYCYYYYLIFLFLFLLLLLFIQCRLVHFVLIELGTKSREMLCKKSVAEVPLRRYFRIVFSVIVNNLCSYLCHSSLCSPTLTTRGHAYKLFKPRCTSGVRQNFYTERVINLLNSLPPTVGFTSLSSFRRTICNVEFSRFMYHQ